jgi:hypothetical protein
MTLLSTVAGVILVVYAVVYLLYAGRSALDVVQGKRQLGDVALQIFGGAAILVAGAVIYLQLNAAIGVGSQANDPYFFEWVNDLLKQISDGSLPTLD